MTNPPVRPAVVNLAAGLLLLSALVWLVALIWPAVIAPPLALAGVAYVVLVLFAWAGRDTRVSIIPALVVLFCVIPLFAAISNPVGLANLGVVGLSALLAAAVAAITGTCLLFHRDAGSYLAQSKPTERRAVIAP